MLKNCAMVLSSDDRRKLAAVYDVFARVDARRKAVRRSRRKSKPHNEKKARSLIGLWAFFSVGIFIKKHSILSIILYDL